LLEGTELVSLVRGERCLAFGLPFSALLLDGQHGLAVERVDVVVATRDRDRLRPRDVQGSTRGANSPRLRGASVEVLLTAGGLALALEEVGGGLFPEALERGAHRRDPRDVLEAPRTRERAHERADRDKRLLERLIDEGAGVSFSRIGQS